MPVIGLRLACGWLPESSTIAGKTADFPDRLCIYVAYVARLACGPSGLWPKCPVAQVACGL